MLSIWIINAFLQTGMLALLLWKRAWRQHPAFVIYIAFCSCKTPALMWVYSFCEPGTYVLASACSKVLSIPIVAAVLVELFTEVFRPFSSLPDGTMPRFRGAMTSIFLLTGALAVCYPGPDRGLLVTSVMILNRSAAIVFWGGFSSTALLSLYFGIPLHHRTYGIGLGFIVFLTVDLPAASAGTLKRLAFMQIPQVVSMLAYSVAVCIWLYYFGGSSRLRTAPSRAEIFEVLRLLQIAKIKLTSRARDLND